METRPTMTQEEIVSLAKSGADAKFIIKRLQETNTVMALSAGEIVKLHGEGVPQEALDYMQAAQMAEIRRREMMFSHMYYGMPFGHNCMFPPSPVFHPRFGWRFVPYPGC